MANSLAPVASGTPVTAPVGGWVRFKHWLTSFFHSRVVEVTLSSSAPSSPPVVTPQASLEDRIKELSSLVEAVAAEVVIPVADPAEVQKYREGLDRRKAKLKEEEEKPGTWEEKLNNFPLTTEKMAIEVMEQNDPEKIASEAATISANVNHYVEKVRKPLINVPSPATWDAVSALAVIAYSINIRSPISDFTKLKDKLDLVDKAVSLAIDGGQDSEEMARIGDVVKLALRRNSIAKEGQCSDAMVRQAKADACSALYPVGVRSVV